MSVSGSFMPFETPATCRATPTGLGAPTTQQVWPPSNPLRFDDLSHRCNRSIPPGVGDLAARIVHRTKLFDSAWWERFASGWSPEYFIEAFWTETRWALHELPTAPDSCNLRYTVPRRFMFYVRTRSPLQWGDRCSQVLVHDSCSRLGSGHGLHAGARRF